MLTEMKDDEYDKEMENFTPGQGGQKRDMRCGILLARQMTIL